MGPSSEACIVGGDFFYRRAINVGYTKLRIRDFLSTHEFRQDLQMPGGAAFEPEVAKATLLNSAGRIIAVSAGAAKIRSPSIAVRRHDTLLKRDAGRCGPSLISQDGRNASVLLRETLTG